MENRNRTVHSFPAKIRTNLLKFDTQKGDKMLKKLTINSGKENFLPNTITIGTMKSGTTSLHKYLSRHPQIFTSEMKELDYFVESKNWKQGLEWYKGHS